MNRKTFFTRCLATAASFAIIGTVLAKPDTTRIPATLTHRDRVISIPARAVEVAPDVFSLGSTVVDGKVVEGLMFVHRKQDAKPDNPGGGNGGGGKGGSTTSTCYALLAKGARWKSAEPWILNPANNSGLDSSFLLANTAGNFQKWEDAAGTNIMGGGSLTANVLVS